MSAFTAFEDKGPHERRDEAATMRLRGVTGPMCPSCGGFIPRNERPGEYPGALSRRDNETEICSACGQDEAWIDFAGGPTPRTEQRPPSN